ncbi:MAG: sigma-54-dependent transcriptional regulator [Betaproteobacteria bacterium]|nr:sigma-54-dependent Fis family transcriptional regulator [Rhodocyclaceae bacterium]
MSQILVVDDEVGIRELLGEILADEGHSVSVVSSAAEARRARGRARPDLVLLDIWMPDTDGITLLKEWAGSGQLTMPVIMMSGHGTIDTAVEATRIGAVGFLEKPIALQKLIATVDKALARGAAAVPAAAQTLAFLGRSGPVAELRQRLERVRELHEPVLLLGEPGSGEELCARFLHRGHMGWRPAQGEEALRAFLAGLAAGEGTGGTLYLPGVDRLGLATQAALLGSLPDLLRADTRIVATALTTLPTRVAAGEFLPELFARLGAVTLRLPPLREHPEDVPELAGLILGRLVESKETPHRTLSTAALNQLRMYPWPGNLAQLEAVVKSAALAASGTEITPADVGATLSQQGDGATAALGGLSLDSDLRTARDAFERMFFEYHIARAGGNVSRLAERVGLERTHLYRKLKQLGVALPRSHKE